jgi:hypothetical protein
MSRRLLLRPRGGGVTGGRSGARGTRPTQQRGPSERRYRICLKAKANHGEIFLRRLVDARGASESWSRRPGYPPAPRSRQAPRGCRSQRARSSVMSSSVSSNSRLSRFHFSAARLGNAWPTWRAFSLRIAATRFRCRGGLKCPASRVEASTPTAPVDARHRARGVDAPPEGREEARPADFRPRLTVIRCGQPQ